MEANKATLSVEPCNEGVVVSATEPEAGGSTSHSISHSTSHNTPPPENPLEQPAAQPLPESQHWQRRETDRVALLLERIERQERAIETVIGERDRITECCDKQKEVIALLQQKLLQINPSYDQSELTFDPECRDKPSSNARVDSVRSALLRISGVEQPAKERGPNAERYEAFDASEFQPIAGVDESGLIRTVKSVGGSTANGLSGIVGWAKQSLSDCKMQQ